jgi:exonuclease III
LRQCDEANQNPRKHFCSDLHNFLQQRRQEGDEIILTGNFNEALGDETDRISKLCSSLNLVNLMFSLHDSQQTPMYARGKKRLDYDHRLASNHRAFFLDFDEAALFGSQSPRLTSIQRHCF